VVAEFYRHLRRQHLPATALLPRKNRSAARTSSSTFDHRKQRGRWGSLRTICGQATSRSARRLERPSITWAPRAYSSRPRSPPGASWPSSWIGKESDPMFGSSKSGCGASHPRAAGQPVWHPPEFSAVQPGTSLSACTPPGLATPDRPGAGRGGRGAARGRRRRPSTRASRYSTRTRARLRRNPRAANATWSVSGLTGTGSTPPLHSPPWPPAG
jgi:hypothetical protein